MKNNTTKNQLLDIAKKHSAVISERGDLGYRNSDSEDFLDISVGAIAAMLEDAYRLGYHNGLRESVDFHKFLRPDVQVLRGYAPTDRNDPDSETTAVRFSTPSRFSKKAKDMLLYLDDTSFLYAYKGRLVLTDESCELTEYGDGSSAAPFGGPRVVCDSWDELERWLETEYDGLEADGLL